MENSPICVDLFGNSAEFGTFCLEFEGRTLNVELVLVLRALLRGPWRDAHAKKTEKKKVKTNEGGKHTIRV